jgi:type II secretory pathway component PulC
LVVSVSAKVSDDIGVLAGDVIVQINDAPVPDAPQAKRMLEALQGRGPIKMYLERSGRIFYTDFQIR